MCISGNLCVAGKYKTFQISRKRPHYEEENPSYGVCPQIILILSSREQVIKASSHFINSIRGEN